MRLICPNCGAQYEVADDVIPTGGRDVQCSNCGHTWLENPGASAAAEAEMEADVVVADVVEDASATVAPVVDDADEGTAESVEDVADAEGDAVDDMAAPAADAVDDIGETLADAADELPDMPDIADAADTAEAAIDDAAEDFSGSISEAFADLETDETPAELPDTVTEHESAEGEQMPTEAPKRQPVDASIAAILQEEAARETAARQAEAAPLESQDDLGLTDPPAPAPEPRAEETRRLIEGLQDEDVEAEVAATAAAAGSRRELLPDIEEINSSLRSSAERGDEMIEEPEEIAAEKKRGFRFGFITVLIVIALLVLLYIFAPRIGAAVPALAGVMESYVEGVDAARIWLDIQMQNLLTMIEPAAEGADAATDTAEGADAATDATSDAQTAGADEAAPEEEPSGLVPVTEADN